MRRIILVTALSLICGSAFAQGSTGPNGQGEASNKPGVGSPAPMHKTTGMSKQHVSKDGMKKTTGGESKDGQGMSNGGAMSK